MLSSKIGYSYSDVSIIPAAISDIEHRADCRLPETLPIFTSPMDSVVGKENYKIYEENGIIPILPRTESLEDRLVFEGWAAYGLDEIKEHYKEAKGKILIDIANGHMEKLYIVAKEIKSARPEVEVMVGNIANPETLMIAAEAGVDYIRLGIGPGAGCVTSSNTSIHFPQASLIDECARLKRTRAVLKNIKLVADGGIRGYGDVCKALALGADYVMIGSVLAQAYESSGKILYKDEIFNGGRKLDYPYSYSRGKFYDEGKEIVLQKVFYGMASGEGQIAIGGKKTKTSEGIKKILPCTYTLSAWTENMRSYLRSSMSYVNAHDLDEYREKCELMICSLGTQNAVNK